MDTTERLRQFIKSEFLLNPEETIKLDYNLLENGIIDSIGMMRLVMFIEKEFDISVFAEEMTFENLMSIENISDFISNKKMIS